MSTEIVPVQEASPVTLFTRATDVAGVCGEIVKRTARNIQGRKYVQVEGWQSIAAAYGCIASSTHVEKVEGGTKAVGELRRVADGALLATAEGFVGEDEPTWYGGESRGKTLPKRHDFAIRAMAQTRAISRVCRTAFAFVVVLIDGNLATTPAEEMTTTEVEITGEIPTGVIGLEAAMNLAAAFADCDDKAEADFLKIAKIARIDQLPAADLDEALEWVKRRKEKRAKKAA